MDSASLLPTFMKCTRVREPDRARQFVVAQSAYTNFRMFTVDARIVK